MGDPTEGPPPVPLLALPTWLAAVAAAFAPPLYGPRNPARPGGTNHLGGKDLDLSVVPRKNHAVIPDGYDMDSGKSLDEHRQDVFAREYERLYALKEEELAVLIPGYAKAGVGLSPYIEADAGLRAQLQSHAAYSALVQTLNPEKSRRYRQESIGERGTKYKCNVFATDLVNNMPQGAYLPKLRYVDPAAAAAGGAGTAKAVSVGPDGINDYLSSATAEAHGWIRIEGENEGEIRTLAQERANAGQVVVASGGGTSENIGHVATIAPEVLSDHGAKRNADGVVTRNVGSKAGDSPEGVVPFGRLDIFFKEDGHHHYSNPGIWYYDPARDTR